jgi:hypothetical protein
MWFRMWFTAVPCGYGIESYGSEKIAISWPLDRLLYFLSKYSSRGESVRSTSVTSKMQGAQKCDRSSRSGSIYVPYYKRYFLVTILVTRILSFCVGMCVCFPYTHKLVT